MTRRRGFSREVQSTVTRRQRETNAGQSIAGVFNQLFSVVLAGLHVIMNVKHVTPCLAQRRCPVNMSLVFHLLFISQLHVGICVCVCVCVCVCIGFPGGSVGEEPSCNARDSGSVPGLGRSPGGEYAAHSSVLA